MKFCSPLLQTPKRLIGGQIFICRICIDSTVFCDFVKFLFITGILMQSKFINANWGLLDLQFSHRFIELLHFHASAHNEF